MTGGEEFIVLHDLRIQLKLKKIIKNKIKKFNFTWNGKNDC